MRKPRALTLAAAAAIIVGGSLALSGPAFATGGHHGHGHGTHEPCQEPSTPTTGTPTPEPTTEPPAPVTEPRVQDYISCKGGAFVLDNTGSTVDVTYTINDLPYVVPAGQAVHTDADGTILQPNSDYEGYTIVAGETSWNFPSAGNCPVPEPETPVTEEPTPDPTPTDEPGTPAPTDEPTTPAPTDEPTVPVETPSAEPTAPVTVSPAPEASTEPTTEPTRTAVVVPAGDQGTTPPAASAKAQDGTLAYTGTDAGAFLPWALVLIGSGAALLAVRSIRRNRTR